MLSRYELKQIVEVLWEVQGGRCSQCRATLTLAPDAPNTALLRTTITDPTNPDSAVVFSIICQACNDNGPDGAGEKVLA